MRSAINRADTLFGSVQEPQHAHGMQGREVLLHHPGSASGIRMAGPGRGAARHNGSPGKSGKADFLKCGMSAHGSLEIGHVPPTNVY